MKIFDTIKAKATGQEAIVSGSVIANVKGKVMGEQNANTPILNKVKEKLPAQQSTSGPIRNFIASKTAAPGAGGLFGDERADSSQRPLGMATIFGKDLN